MEANRGSSDGEDIPSDFFDDFNKEEFMEGLSVIDSWDPGENKASTSRSRINAETIDSVQDLRELIRDGQDEKKNYEKYENTSKQRMHSNMMDDQRGSKDHSRSASRMDEYIKPGSRRDPSKTNKAIKKDKEVKVKEYLAKHLESSDDIRPPGTELDEFFEDRRIHEDLEKESETFKVSSARKSGINSPPRERRMSPSCRYRRESPMKHRVSPQRYRHTNWSPRRPHYNDFYRSPRRSPHRNYFSPHRNFKRFHKYSPQKPHFQFRREHRSRSPYKSFHRRSRSPRPAREYHRSRSRSYRPEREDYRRSRSNSSSYKVTRDNFSYQSSSYQNPVKDNIIYQSEPLPQYSGPVTPFPANVPNYSYAPVPAYSGYTNPFEYGALPVMPVPQPVPAPSISLLSSETTPHQAPTMVPAPIKMISPGATTSVTPQLINTGNNAPMDPLAQMVADGKLSHEDYLKLAPNKDYSFSGSYQSMDNNVKDEVLHRCYSAISKLSSMVLPNRLIINNNLFGPEIKQITPKFCSPLKRQAPLEFQFSKFNPSVITQQNKQIVDSIVATLSLEKIVGITKKKVKKDSKDVAVQTTKSFCDMCVIRESTKFNNVGTCIDREQFSKAVHTQVVDQDLASSQSVFNPSGSVTEGATISIAHMTPAQLVSQLAARAKTLKQTEPQSSNQYRRNNYDQDSRGQYRHSYNYRY